MQADPQNELPSFASQTDPAHSYTEAVEKSWEKMKSEYLIDDVFHVDGKPFEFIVTRDREIILLNLIAVRDNFGHREPLDFYRAVNPITGAKVYRIVIQKALEAIFGRGFKTFHFSIGMEKRRYPLYKLLAERIAKKGFDCYDCGGHFYFYKQPKPAL